VIHCSRPAKIVETTVEAKANVPKYSPASEVQPRTCERRHLITAPRHNNIARNERHLLSVVNRLRSCILRSGIRLYLFIDYNIQGRSAIFWCAHCSVTMEAKAGDLEGLATTSTQAMKNQVASSNGGDAAKDAPIEHAPDPEEDDLDDLDGTSWTTYEVHLADPMTCRYAG
jgi:hypothetical protein